MADLVLLNGPPASGKSTLAHELVRTRPLALNLDIDVVRGQLGEWLTQPIEAGFAARALALAMARAHLAAGHDVFVPQFLGQPDFIHQLEALATECTARFVEVALVISLDDARSAWERRSLSPETQSHADAVSLVSQSTSEDPVADMHRQFTALLATRPDAVRIAVVPGDLAATLALVEDALGGLAGTGPQ